MSVPVKTASAEAMEALIVQALHRWRTTYDMDVSDALLASAIMCAIQTEVLKAKEDIISTLARSFKGAA